jgi:phosphoglycerate dehydrogenase-like enzyme
MDAINVLVLSAIGEENLRRIADVSPRIRVVDASKVWDEREPIEMGKAGAIDPEFEAMLAEAEVLYGYGPPPNLVTLAPKLKWFQTMLAGVDHILHQDIVKSRVTLTNASGVHATPVGEVALGMMLILAKQSLFCFQSKMERSWERFIPDVLHDKTAGIIGLGSIGSEIARMCKALGMSVLATRRSARKVSRARHVDMLLPREQLGELLCQSDYVVMVLPSTPGTYHLVGEAELRMMKPSAYLINVGRGNTVDEEALVRACEEKRIAGAGLDAFTAEPLPKESKLWDLPNVFFSPHVSGRLKNYDDVTTKLFCENLTRYVNSRKLFNVVNKKRGY